MIPALDELTAEAMVMRGELGDETLPALAHYTTADEVIVVPVSDLGDTYAVVAQVVPQIYTRFGPASSIVVVDDADSVLWLLVATIHRVVVRRVPYENYRGHIIWHDPETMSGPTADLADVFHQHGMGAAIAAALHEPGRFN